MNTANVRIHRKRPHLARTADSGRDTGSPGSRGTGNQSNGRPGEVVTGKRGRQATGVVNQRNPARPRPRADEDSGKIKVTSALNFGKWNVLTMRKLGKLEMMEKEMADHDLGCLGLSETRWTGKGHFVTDLGSTVIYSGLEDKKASGVAVMLDRMRAKSLLGYNPISDRILTVRLAAKPWNVTIIQIYAPTNQAPESESIHFYSCLQQVVSDTPKQDVMIICGDFNAKIGEGAPIGKEALGKRNENGQRLIDFAIANRLIAANAITRQHARKKYTWRSFNGLHRNQIDYVLVQKRWQSAVAKCRSYPGADADSDHVLVGMKFKIKLKRLQQTKRRENYDFSQSEQYRLELLNRYACLDTPEASDPSALSESADDEWQHLKRNMLESAHSTMRK